MYISWAAADRWGESQRERDRENMLADIPYVRKRLNEWRLH